MDILDDGTPIHTRAKIPRIIYGTHQTFTEHSVYCNCVDTGILENFLLHSEFYMISLKFLMQIFRNCLIIFQTFMQKGLLWKNPQVKFLCKFFPFQSELIVQNPAVILG